MLTQELSAYWWSRYGNYRPGKANLPHTGDVVVDHRSRRYSSQAEFAAATGVDKQTVAYWENVMYLQDPDKRIFIARMLKIPPALLGLTWQQVAYKDNRGTLLNPLDHFVELVEEDSYYHYEDTLVMAWGWFYNGRVLEIADRFERRLRKLENRIQYVPEHDREAWIGLLCLYYALFYQIIRHRGLDGEHKRQALSVNAGAVRLVQDTEDAELTAMLLSNRADLQFEQEHYAQAKAMARAARDQIKKVRTNTPVYGNVLLRNACVFAPFTANDDRLAENVRGWLNKALNIVWQRKDSLEPDRTFMKLNLAGVHHERAKVFLQFHQFHPNRGYLIEAENEIKLAWDAFTPEFAEWKVFFHLTEARILEVRRDIEKSAQAGVSALHISKAMGSKKRELQIEKLYYDLSKIDPGNPYVHNLGAELGIFN